MDLAEIDAALAEIAAAMDIALKRREGEAFERLQRRRSALLHKLYNESNITVPKELTEKLIAENQRWLDIAAENQREIKKELSRLKPMAKAAMNMSGSYSSSSSTGRLVIQRG